MHKKRFLLPGFFLAGVATAIGGLFLYHFLERSFLASNKTPLVQEKKATYTAGGGPVNLEISGMLIRVSPQIQLHVDSLRALIFPRGKSSAIFFDDPTAYFVRIQEGNIRIGAPAMEAIFNDLVFGKDQNLVRNIAIQFPETSQKKTIPIRIKGEMNMVVWIPFLLEGQIFYDKFSGFIVVEILKINTLGNPYAGNIMKQFGMNIEILMAKSTAKGIQFKKNRFFISPLALLPPPSMEGTILQLATNAEENSMSISFSSSGKSPKNRTKGKNFLSLGGGNAVFGNIHMSPADLLLLDADPSDEFDFSLRDYRRPLVKSTSRIKDSGGVIVLFPDYSD